MGVPADEGDGPARRRAVTDTRTWAAQTMAILETMTPEHRSVLRALYFDHQSLTEIAERVREPEPRIARRAAVAAQLFAAATLSAS